MNINKTVYLIRHGESLHNRDGNQLSGVTDVVMSPEGIKQCYLLAQCIDRFQIQRIYSSPLSRAIKTANIIFPNQKATIKQDLIEFNYGEYEGRIANMISGDPIIDQWNHSPGNLTFPGGDNTANHAEKIYTALKDIAQLSSETPIACITHRTSMRLLIAKILEVPLNKFRSIPCSNCSLTEVNVNENGEMNIVALNATLKYLTEKNQ